MTSRVLQVSQSPLKEKFRCMIDDCEDGRLKKDPFSDQPISTPKMKLKGCREGHLMQYDHIVLTLDEQLITEDSEDISTVL
ncbi:hypothetical protein G5714_009836 [Onychostoma macrolepis]|uniref:Uncharacterized protein n=1 Tax=Onychostoma macrolepis TaxID=369639 RepID=A0A7J6CQF9_9TELE|nr:hypothetical protein G5714_009836 [Onychostoma macrolepis]